MDEGTPTGTAEMLDLLRKSVKNVKGGDEALKWLAERESRTTALEQKLKKQQIDFSTVIEIANQVNSKGLDLKRIEGYVISMLRGQFGVLHAFVMRQSLPDDAVMEVTAPPRTSGDAIAFASDGPISASLLEIGRPLLRGEIEELTARVPEFKVFLAGKTELLVPLIHSGAREGKSLKGVMCLGGKIGGAKFADADRDLLSLLGDMIAISLHNAQLYHRSIIDGLTKVYSRGHFDVHLFQEISRARRFLQREENRLKPDSETNKFVSLVMVDIDHFKKFNDTYGHQTGDKVLKSVAYALHQCVRTMDVVARYGGEEFALIFPETRKSDALNIAERLRSSVEKIPIDQETGDSSKITISLGVATFPGDAEDMRGLISSADKALYRAKGSGRNRVCDAALAEGGT